MKALRRLRAIGVTFGLESGTKHSGVLFRFGGHPKHVVANGYFDEISSRREGLEETA